MVDFQDNSRMWLKVQSRLHMTHVRSSEHVVAAVLQPHCGFAGCECVAAEGNSVLGTIVTNQKYSDPNYCNAFAGTVLGAK